MLTAIVFFVLGYFTHKYKDVLIKKLQTVSAKLQDYIDSKR